MPDRSAADAPGAARPHPRRPEPAPRRRTRRILLRSPRDPFDPAAPEVVLERNLIATNSGNLVFMDAAHKILSAPGVEVVADGLAIATSRAGEINERYDAYVIPLANAFRRSYELQLVRMTQLIRKLRIPVVILGVGAEANLQGSFEPLGRMERSIRAFVGAVLDRGPSIGVRGEATAGYLAGLGFRDVDVIGCPSMFQHGPRLDVRKRHPNLDAHASIGLTVSPYVHPMAKVVMHHYARYRNLTYIPQDLATLELLLWGDNGRAPDDPDMPVHAAHPLFREDKIRFYTHSRPWIRDLGEMDFVFGTRIHGTIAALIAGTPAWVFAHDSRTLELARYFGIPHQPMPEVPSDVDAADLYEAADYGPLVVGHPARFRTFAAFLARHGLDHVFAHDGAEEAYEARVSAVELPSPVGIGSLVASPGPRQQVRRLRYRVLRGMKTSPIRALAGRILSRSAGVAAGAGRGSP
jgi:hypothetical protein